MAANCRFAFAVHVLAVLASRGAHGVTSRALAASVNTNPVVIRRILSTLRQAGFVQTRRGAGAEAGSQLTRHPAEISLDTVYRAISPASSFSPHPHTPDERCVVGRNIEMVLGEVFQSARTALEEALARRTLADVLKTVSDDGAIAGGRLSKPNKSTAPD